MKRNISAVLATMVLVTGLLSPVGGRAAVTANAAITSTTAVGENSAAVLKAFTDVDATHWAIRSIQRWSGNGIVNGYGDGTFKPNQEVTKAEFAAIMNRIFNFLNQAEALPTDVSSSSWFYKDISKSISAGYLAPDENNRIYPSKPFTREEAALALQKVFRFTEGKSSAVPFKDLSGVKEQNVKAIEALVAAGYLQGYSGGLFKPQGVITRAELAVMTDRMISSLVVNPGATSLGTVKGNVVINLKGVTLKDTVIEGNLYLTEGIGDGAVVLEGVKVTGTTFVQGAGNKKLVFKGNFQEVLTSDSIEKGSELSLSGQVSRLSLNSPSKVLLGDNTSIGELLLTRNAKGTVIEGSGTISAVDNNADGVTLGGTAALKGKTGSVTLVKPTVTNAPAGNGNGGGSVPTPTVTPEATATPTTSPRPTDNPWTLEWSDEFSDGTIDSSKWTYDLGDGTVVGNPGWGNNELQYYTNDTKNVKEDGGNLVITALKEEQGGKSYTSSRIKTKGLFSQKYGKFEIRAKTPAGKGYWPAIWMLPEEDVYGTWAASGEIDIMEGWGSKPQTVAGTLHYGSQYPNNSYTSKAYQFKDGKTVEDFHTYTLEWEPGEIRWYVDGELYSTQNDWYGKTAGQAANNSYPAPFDQKFHLLMNLAVGGNFDGAPDSSTVFPKSFVIDYVRVYKLTGRSYREPIPPTYAKEAYLDGAKLPQEDGNLVYNSNFTQNVNGDAGMGTPGTANWVLYKDPGAAAAVNIVDVGGKNFAKVSITNAGGNSYSIQPQSIVSLAKGRFYKLTFDAKTDVGRNIDVKVTGGATRNYDAYSESLPVSLTDELGSYEMSFQMKRDSDNAARIEFNMGINTSPVWIGNVKLVELESIPFVHDAPKMPQGDGNHVYNGTFDQGEPNRLSYWHINSTGAATASGKVDEEKRKLDVEITNGTPGAGDVILLQKGVFMLEDQNYRLTFDAKVSAAREFQVVLANGNGTEYTRKTINVIPTQGQYSVTFTGLAGVSDPTSQLQLHLGGSPGNVVLDNIKLIRTSTYFPPGTVFFPLINGDFSEGLNAWEPISDSGGYTEAAVVNGEAKVTVGSQGGNPWSSMLIQNGLPLSAGVDYTVSFDARSTANRKMNILAENASNKKYLNETIDLSGTKTAYSFEFNMSTNDVVSLKFLLGLLAGTNAVGSSHDVFIDNVKFEVKDPNVLRPPGLRKDTTGNKAGRDITITFMEDAAWRQAVASVFLGSTRLDQSKYTLSSGELILDGSLFPEEGSYKITVNAGGYASTLVTQPLLSNDGNLVVNGAFSNGTNSWAHYVHPDAGSEFKIENGIAKLVIGYKGNETWHTQFYQEGIRLENGKTYKLSFKANSTQERPIIVEYTNTSIPAVNFKLNTVDSIYTNTFKANANGLLKLNFLLGNVTMGTSTTPATAHTISIDDVVIQEVEAELPDTQAPTVPVGLTSPSKTVTSIDLSWTASTDNKGVSGYDVYKDGAFVQSTTTTSYTVSGLTANTSYAFTVKAKDAAGNESAPSEALAVVTETAGSGGGGEPSEGQPALGAGSYTTVLPFGAHNVQSMIYKTANVTEKMPTNDWWSNLAWDKYSEAQYPHPLAMKNQADGLRIYYPGNRITANSVAIAGWMNDIHDFVVGNSNESSFPDAKVDDFSDWFVSALYKNGDHTMKATYGHGSPFVYFTYGGGNPKISFYTVPEVWSGNADSPVLGITIAGAHYALFGPTGSTWSGIGTKVLTNNLGDKDYFSIAILPEKTEAALNKFKQYAYSHVTDTKVSWSYNASASEVNTTYTYTTVAKEGIQNGTLFSLYPHQWENSSHTFLGYTYNSVRGLLKVAEGSSFETTMKFTGVLPSLPDLGTYNRTTLAAYVDEAEAEIYTGDPDTYWVGKRLGKLATLAPIADQVGDTAAAEKFRDEIKARLEDWFTATNGSGQLKSSNLFYYNDNWGTLLGYPDSFGSVLELNDHHFHYGYFIKAAAEIARVDKEWAKSQNWGSMVNLLISDTANGNRQDLRFPFLRNFDPYAGHSWASGHARFGDGNNNESSSEAMNAWAGLILWGEATGDTAIRDLGIYQYTTEMNAINDYWFDVNGENHDPNFTRSTASMIWGGKTVGDGVWWTANPEEVHGINWLPITGASLYLTQYPEYTGTNYTTMVTENGGTSFNVWEDLIYMYRAISNVDDAKAKFSAKAAAMTPEAGNSKANAYHWIYNLDALGNEDRTVTADYPVYAVFNKDGVKTYLVYNMTDEELTVTFSDGHTVTAAANSFNIGNGGDPIVPDTEPPSKPLGLTSTAKTTLSVTLSWTPSTDNTKVTGYDIYVGGVLKDSVTTVTYKVNGLTPNTAYTFTVKAKDEAGNQSQYSEELTLTTDPAGVEPEEPALVGPVILYLTGEGQSQHLSDKAGGVASEVNVPSAAGGNHFMEPVNPVVYTMSNVNADYKEGMTGYQLYFDTLGEVVGTALMVRISYDFDGDGTWDRMEKSPTYALNPVQNEWERFTQTDRGTLSITGSDYQNFHKGILRIEIWNQLGTADTKVKVNAPSDYSRFVLPYDYSSGI